MASWKVIAHLKGIPQPLKVFSFVPSFWSFSKQIDYKFRCAGQIKVQNDASGLYFTALAPDSISTEHPKWKKKSLCWVSAQIQAPGFHHFKPESATFFPGSYCSLHALLLWNIHCYAWHSRWRADSKVGEWYKCTGAWNALISWGCRNCGLSGMMHGLTRLIHNTV